MTLPAAEAQLSIAQRFRIAKARALRLLIKTSGGTDPHTDWMNECVPQLMDGGKDQIVAVAACLNMWRQVWEETHPDGAVDPGPERPDKRLQVGLQNALARSRDDKAFDPSEPRDPDGKWTDGGGSGSSPDIADATLDPKVVEVGGDAWNKATARRLEREYQATKPKLEELLSKLDKGKPTDDATPVADEDEPDDSGYVPQTWDGMTTADQTDTEEQYYSQELSNYIESENNNWYDNGGALDEAKATLVSDDEFIHDTINELMEGDDAPEFPYTVDQLTAAITLDYESDGEGSGDLKVNFNDAGALQKPINAPPEEQDTLPGIEPEDLSKRLTENMRAELTTAIEKAFDKKASDMKSSVTPPDYLAESAKEYMEENWTHNMSDDEKYNYAKKATDIIKNLEEAAGTTASAISDSTVTGVPDAFDPLNKTSGADYQKTQRVARLISVKRSQDVLKERNLPDPGFKEMNEIDSNLWSAWKSSSTSMNGMLLQLATADELGGRLNEKTGRDGIAEIKRPNIEGYANNEFSNIGGYAGIKAYIRAKWETTQFLLDKANISELELYRGIALDTEKLQQADREKMIENIMRKQMVEGHTKVPNLHVVRNGAASTTTNANIANGWSSDASRLVLRGLMPRTAAVSVPAYGINVKSEQEVVVAGTAWKAWDAWLGKAPKFSAVPMAMAA